MDKDGFSRLHKRCTWLNGNVFQESPITKEVIQSLESIDMKRGFEILKEMEEKQEKMKNPSGYLKKAIARENDFVIDDKVKKRVRWINFNVYKRDAIDDEATAALSAVSWEKAMAICKELEEKGETVNNPTKYVKAACTRELTKFAEQGMAMMPMAMMQPMPMAAGFAMPDMADGQVDSGIYKRCKWLNTNLLEGKAIGKDSMFALQMLGFKSAMRLCKEIEEKAGEIRNPNKYIQAAVGREAGNGGAAQSDFGTLSKVAKRCTWLSSNVFTESGIQDDAVSALATLGFQRAMALCKELEEKGAEKVANPSGYIKAAVKREGFGSQGGPSKRAKRL